MVWENIGNKIKHSNSTLIWSRVLDYFHFNIIFKKLNLNIFSLLLKRGLDKSFSERSTLEKNSLN